MAKKWQTTAHQRIQDGQDGIDKVVADYAARLAAVHAAHVRLYRALLETDNNAAEMAAGELRYAVNQLPPVPAWPDTDEELIDRLRGKFAPLVADKNGKTVLRWNGDGYDYRPLAAGARARDRAQARDRDSARPGRVRVA